MTLQQVILSIEAVAGNQPTIASIVRNDVFRLNSMPDAKYGVFAWLQGEHRTDTESGLMQYAFTFFYVDRLTFDKSNEIEIQSVGIETLENILLALEGAGIYAGEHTFRTFNQRFADDCAGVFCTLTLEVAKDAICPWDFAEPELGGKYFYLRNTDYDISRMGDYAIGLDGTGKFHVRLKFAIANFNTGSVRGCVMQIYSAAGFGLAVTFGKDDRKLYADLCNGAQNIYTSALSDALAAVTGIDPQGKVFAGDVYTLDIWLEAENGAYAFKKINLNGAEVAFTTSERWYSGRPDANQLIIACQEWDASGATRSEAMLGGLLLEKDGVAVSDLDMVGATDTEKITDKITGGVIGTYYPDYGYTIFERIDTWETWVRSRQSGSSGQSLER